METNEKLDKAIGNKETKKLEAKPIKVMDIKIEDQKNKDGKVLGEKAVFICQHPDRDDPIHISSVIILKDKKVTNVGTWYNEDQDGLIAKNSALAELMRFLKVNTLKEVVGKEIQTEIDSGYLAFKAY